MFGVDKFHQYLDGKHFTILSDHKPLQSLFNEERPVPPMASSRVQRWALTLSAYNYSIVFRPGKLQGNADALSRLPLPVSPSEVPIPGDTVLLLEALDLSEEPISASTIKSLTNKDPVLSRFRDSVQHLSDAVGIYNRLVPVADSIQVEGLLSSAIPQKILSQKLDHHLFSSLLEASNIANKARLLSVSSPHAASWLSVPPCERQGLHLDPSQFQVATKWWLGLDTSGGSQCALCPEKSLDPLGHHATTCKCGGDVVFRHNRLRDIVAETCRRAHLGIHLEKSHYSFCSKESSVGLCKAANAEVVTINLSQLSFFVTFGCETNSNISLKQQITSAISLAQDGLYSKACQTLVSSDLAPNNDETWRLLVTKHPKAEINLMAILRSFPKLTAAGPSGLRIQHLIDAAEVPLQTPILHSLRAVINILAAVGEAVRRLVGKCLCAAVKIKAHHFFHPFQFGVACPFGAEKMVHGLRDCIEQHWLEDDFVVLKVDLKNAFNIVSRQAVLDECAKHFPELFPWASWCYSHHPFLWHPLGCLTSEQGVQQGDPLGPLLFSLVLNILVSAISSRDDCAGLKFHAWYLDDGALAGPRSSNILALLQELGPPLGLHVNIRKCEVLGQSSLDCFPSDIKKSNNPNIDILGSPIGDTEFCHKFITEPALKD
eukprot:Em1273g1a